MNQQQFAEFSPHQKTLELMGFSFGNVDANALEITAIHNSLSLDSVPDLLSNFLEEVEILTGEHGDAVRFEFSF